MNIYFISGIGADKRVFKNIQLPEECRAIYLEWIKPFKNETLENYAVRLAEKIDYREPFMLIGLSLGGMLAIEIAKKYNPEHLIIISSIPSSKNLPFYLKIAGKLKLQNLVPIPLLKSISLMKRLFTAETPEEKIYLRIAIKESDPAFIRWAMNAIVTWKSAELPLSYYHIHGTRDELLPIKYSTPTHIIKGGGHLMILTRAKEINNILQEIYLSKIKISHQQNT